MYTKRSNIFEVTYYSLVAFIDSCYRYFCDENLLIFFSDIDFVKLKKYVVVVAPLKHKFYRRWVRKIFK